MFEVLLKDETLEEQWDMFFVADNQWPEEGTLETYKVLKSALCPLFMRASHCAWHGDKQEYGSEDP